jgi:hypothetical protein
MSLHVHLARWEPVALVHTKVSASPPRHPRDQTADERLLDATVRLYEHRAADRHAPDITNCPNNGCGVQE